MAISVFILGTLLSSTLAIPTNGGTQAFPKETKIVFGAEEMMRTSSHNIWHMEQDLNGEPGAILFSFGSSLKSMQGDEVTDVVGSIDTEGYKEGHRKEAMFNTIQNFLQVTPQKIIIVDRNANCLREFDRIIGITAPYVGQCGKSGYANGDKSNTKFNLPYDVILDIRTNRDLIVVDLLNDALRSVAMETKTTTTIIQDAQKLEKPRAAIFDKNDGNILYITVSYQVIKLSLSDLSSEVLAGSKVPNGYVNGLIQNALFRYVVGDIVQLDDNHLAVADFWNHDVRILDLVNKEVTSLCQSEYNGTSVRDEGCTLRNPHSLFLFNHSLFVGDNGNMHKLPVASIPIGQKSLPSWMGPVCQDRTISATLPTGKNKAKVSVNPDMVLELSAGVHRLTYKDKGIDCIVNIVVRAGMEKCPPSIDEVADPDSGKGVVEMTLGGIRQEFELPIGSHQYSVLTSGVRCLFKINIFDPNVERRLQFEARYNFDCDSYNSGRMDVTMLKTVLTQNYFYIAEICGQDCRQQLGGKPAITCEGDVLKVMYPTDVAYGGDVHDIPADLARALTTRLIGKKTMMSIVDLSRAPPVVFPIKQPNGASAKMLLTSTCLNQRRYDAATGACL